MKIKYIALCLLLALVGCQREEDMEIVNATINNERIDPSYSSVSISCNINCNATINQVKAYISTTTDFSNAQTQLLAEQKKGTYAAKINSLANNTTYYVCYKISNNYSSFILDKTSQFKTIPFTTPTVQTNEVTDVTYNSAIVGGTIKENGGQEIKECGIVYSKSPNSTIENGTKVESNITKEAYTCTLTNLDFATTYYARAYAINEKGIAYGEEVSFTTKTKTIATVATTPATNVSYTSAMVGGNVTEDGGAEVTECGVVYSTNQSPTTEDSKVASGSGLGEFTCNLTDLKDGTIYYARAYAINEKGIAYGEEVCFTTKTKTIAAVVTTPATNVSYTSATVGGNVTDDGGATVTERGICYSTSANPTTANTKITSGSGTGSFVCNLTELQDGTIYYARAYAINEKGIAYGEEVCFTTKTKTIAAVVTTPATNVSYTSATVGGNVTDDGGASVTERGICYSRSANPTTANTKITSGSGWGQFTCNLTDLQDGTTYYVRAYAINAKGTAYGEEVSFMTLSLNGHEYVDLGLSVKWATMNVGASKAEDYGSYFAWGETTTKSTYDWSTYKYCNGSSSTLTKYNNSSSFGTIDNKTELDAIDDAAVVNWGGSWRMPTGAELIELRNNCTWTWTSQNGVNGYKVTSKSNGNSIFLPAAGIRNGSSLLSAGSIGYYWSSSLYTDRPLYAYELYFSSGRVDFDYGTRGYGQSVRPVCP